MIEGGRPDVDGEEPLEVDGEQFLDRYRQLAANIEKRVRGKRDVVDRALTCLFAGGHLLVEDHPGLGKTLLARCIASSIAGRARRIQFTPDLLPTDVTGTNVYHQDTQEFLFHHGPVFANIVLADEINRASPRTQAALLEVMEEEQVTFDGETYELDPPFMVVATQNPDDDEGTYPLPESQLDRFLMRISVGYPQQDAELQILQRGTRTADGGSLQPVLQPAEVVAMTGYAQRLPVHPPVLTYLLDIVTATRHAAEESGRGPGPAPLRLGASPRASVALLRASRALAAARGRDYVTDHEVQDLAVPVLAHRLRLSPEAAVQRTDVDVMTGILREIHPPR